VTDKYAHRVLVRKPEEKKLTERYRRRLTEDGNIKIEYYNIGCEVVDGIQRAQDAPYFHIIKNTSVNPCVP
jgi:hypothetical protein